MKAIRAKALATPTNQLGILESSYGLSDLGVSVEDLRRQQKTGEPEFNAQIAHFRTDVAGLGVNDRTGKAWQDFTTQMDRAGAQISKVFVNGLIPLAAPLEHLSGSIVKVLERVMSKDGIVEQGIEKVASWIENFSGTIGKPEFLTKIQSFTSDVGDLSDAVHTVVWAANHPGEAAAKGFVGLVKADANLLWEGLKFGTTGAWNLLNKQANLARVSAMESKYGLPAGMEKYIFGKESNYGADVKDQPGPNGALGPFQIKPSMSGGADLHNFDAASERAAQILATELKHYGGDIKKAIAAYNLGDPAVDKLVGKYGKDWQSHVPYLAQVKIENATGGNVVVTVNGLQ